MVFITSTARSRSSTPMWMRRPKARMRRAIICALGHLPVLGDHLLAPSQRLKGWPAPAILNPLATPSSNICSRTQKLLARIVDVGADGRADGDRPGADHVGKVGVGCALVDDHPLARHGLRGIAQQLARLRVDQLVLFFDADVGRKGSTWLLPT